MRRWLAAYYPYFHSHFSLDCSLSWFKSRACRVIALCVSLVCVSLGKYFAFSSLVTSSVIVSVFFMTQMSVLLSFSSLFMMLLFSFTIISCHLIRAQKGVKQKSCKIYAKARRCETHTFPSHHLLRSKRFKGDDKVTRFSLGKKNDPRMSNEL